MADQSKTTAQLPVKSAANSANDFVIFMFGSNTSAAQTALVSISNIFANTPNLTIRPANLQMNIISSSPANSASLTIAQGTLFFDTQFGYFVTSSNHIKRWTLSDF